MFILNFMHKGLLFGALNIVMSIPALLLPLLFIYIEFLGNTPTLLSVTLVIAVDFIFLITLIYFMLGIKAVAKKIKKADLAHHILTFIELTVIEHALLIFSWVASYNQLPLLAALLILLAAPATLLIGLFMIQIAENLLMVPARLTKEAARISFWYSMAGYLTTSVIFAPLGSAIFVVAKIYMWKLLRQEAGNEIRTPVPLHPEE